LKNRYKRKKRESSTGRRAMRGICDYHISEKELSVLSNWVGGGDCKNQWARKAGGGRKKWPVKEKNQGLYADDETVNRLNSQ